MGRVNIYVPDIKLKRIDEYCKERKVARGVLLVNSALSVINSKHAINCSFCKRPSIGKYSITTYDWEQGDATVEKSLCEEHYRKAKVESASVKEIG